jgi:hypothetical protein
MVTKTTKREFRSTSIIARSRGPEELPEKPRYQHRKKEFTFTNVTITKSPKKSSTSCAERSNKKKRRQSRATRHNGAT